jgi:cell division protein FtsI (penicillin-binding protein 3)
MASSSTRLTAAFVALALVFGVFAVRLVQLQGLDSSRYAAMAASERLREISLPAVRGPILDANGVPLVTTVDAVDLIVDQTQLDNPAAAALQLAGPLDRDPAELQEAMTGDSPYVRLQRTVEGPVWSQIRGLGIAGIYSEPSADRAYPAGTVAANLIGFTGSNGLPGVEDRTIGLAGLEASYEDVLAGVPGSFSYERDSAGRAIPLADQTRVEPVPGQGLRLTIDRDIQWFVEKTLAAKVEEADAESGSAIVLDPQTGAIIALADAPVVDPDNPGSASEEDRGSRAVSAPYEPGSVQKVLTLAAAVDSGAVSPDDVFTVPDSILRDGWPRPISDFAPHEDWELTTAGILAKSSNVGTIMAAEQMDKGELRDYLVKFGYGEVPGIGMPGEEPGLMPQEWSDLRRDTISYGQGVATTIVHLASAYGAIANDGLRVPPRLVDAVVAGDGAERPVARDEPVQVVSEQTADEVLRMMEAVVAPGGTASNVTVDGYRLAGKTGTAEQLNAAGSVTGYTATFAGIAPADDPQLVVVVSIQEPKQGRYGGQLGGPVFSDIMDFALPRLGIAPSGTPAPTVPIFAE